MIDLEHSTISFEQLSIMIDIIQKTGTEAWVRVGKNDEYLIKTLDLGPEGLIIPNDQNLIDAQKAQSIQNIHQMEKEVLDIVKLINLEFNLKKM